MDRQRIALEIIVGCFLFAVNEYRFNIFQYQPITPAEELGNTGRIQWVSGRPGQPPAYAGTDFIVARDGRIAALYLFFDKFFDKQERDFALAGKSANATHSSRS